MLFCYGTSSKLISYDLVKEVLTDLTMSSHIYISGGRLLL